MGAGPFTYDATAHQGGSGVVSGAGILTWSPTLTFVGDQVDAGTCYVTAHYAGDANHEASDGLPVAVTIGKAAATVRVKGYGGPYDGSAHGLSGSAIGVGGVDLGAGLSLGGTRTNAGTTAVDWSFDGGQNYLGAGGAAVISIARAASTTVVAILGGPFTYTGSAQAPQLCR